MNDVYAALKHFFSQVDNVVVNDGKGAQGIKHAGKMFAMFYKGDLTLKFSPERVTELIESGQGLPHDPGTGKSMKDRILIPASQSETWIELTEESLEYVSKKKGINDLPWRNYPSLFDHIKNNLDSNGKLTDWGNKLPDESRRYKEGELRWVSGGMDGAFSHHFGGNQKTIAKIVNLTQVISAKGRLEDKIEVYHILLKDNLMEYIDPTLEKIINLEVYPEPYLHNWAKWLAFESPDRGTVKFGIALLGLIRDKRDFDKLMILGKHEEFTLYVAVAITNIFEESEAYLWELAKHIHGWGKIHLVERLSETDNPEIKKWLLYEGYKNSVMYEYLAYICATAGDLIKELSNRHPDTKLLKSAGEMIEALINGGPAEDISNYKDAAKVIQLYLGHTLGKVYTIDQLLTLHTIQSYLSNKETNWKELSRNGWMDDLRANLLGDINRELSLPVWRNLVNEKKYSADNDEFWKVDQAANIFGIDMWDVHWKKLLDKPNDSSHWYHIMKSANNERIDQVLELAMKKIDINKIFTGAEDNMGLGKDYKLHHCLDFIIQGLDKYPGKGVNLILAALKSPVTRNRNMAIGTLNVWGYEYITDDIKKLIVKAKKVEPDADTKKNLNNLLKRQFIE
ncbi:MAG: hypothetical protein MJB14_07535 [Spirochaetes bacterium]|nr:hypothetical protein [Spirochaetota bacterium]